MRRGGIDSGGEEGRTGGEAEQLSTHMWGTAGTSQWPSIETSAKCRNVQKIGFIVSKKTTIFSDIKKLRSDINFLMEILQSATLVFVSKKHQRPPLNYESPFFI